MPRRRQDDEMMRELMAMGPGAGAGPGAPGAIPPGEEPMAGAPGPGAPPPTDAPPLPPLDEEEPLEPMGMEEPEAEFPGLRDPDTRAEVGQLLSRLFDLLTEGGIGREDDLGELEELAEVDFAAEPAEDDFLTEMVEEERRF